MRALVSGIAVAVLILAVAGCETLGGTASPRQTIDQTPQTQEGSGNKGVVTVGGESRTRANFYNR